MRYRGVIYAREGFLFRGAAKRVWSSWFATKQEAEDWIYAMSDGQEDKLERAEIQCKG